MILRPYQQKFADDIVRSLVKHRKVIACMATGGGKTAVFLSLTERALAKGLAVLVITESTKIFTQLEAQLKAFHIRAGVNNVPVWNGKAYIAMAQTLVRRDKLLAAFKVLGSNLLVINDEAHVGTGTKVLMEFPDAQLIGVTATPDWKAAKHLPKLYNHCVVGPQPDDLVQSGHLSPYRHFARVSASMDMLKIQNGEFTEASQEAAFGAAKVFKGLIEDLRRVPYKKCMIFTASIKHATTVYGELLKAGLPAIVAHSQTEYDMRLFTHGDINICVSVAVFTRGYDFPRIDLVAMYRATTSLPLCMQMIGRGSRIYPGKTHFTVLDYGENFKRHGLWDAEIDWGNKWQEQKKKKTDGAAPIKDCPQCAYLVAASSMKCPNCGYIFEKIVVPETEENTKLIALTAAYQAMTGRKLSSLSPTELATYARLKNKKLFAFRVAKSHAQKNGFEFLEQFGIAMGYKRQWARMQYEEILINKIDITFTDIILR